MQAFEVVAKKARGLGITTAELARRTDIDQELLRRSLAGDRNIKADELISICTQLGLEIGDFMAQTQMN